MDCPKCGTQMLPELFQPNITSANLSHCSTDTTSPSPAPIANTNWSARDGQERPIVKVSIYICSNPSCGYRKQILEE
jgi:hypothetical protein